MATPIILRQISNQMVDLSPGQAVYPSKSALQNYYLESSLPEFVLNRQYNIKPLPKTREFYKNNVFIWNNPYRCSKRNYQYFHKQQQEYKPVEDKIRQQALEERQKTRMQRINLLKLLREQDRSRLKSRRAERQKLESQASGDNLHFNTLESNTSNPRTLKRKLRTTCRTEQRISTVSSIDLLVQTMLKDTLTKERESRLQQLRDRKAEIEQLQKKAGQANRMSRPATGVRRSHHKLSM